MASEISIDDIATFCKRKGFVYRASDIYEGLSGFFDYGPLGVELKNNIKQSWWSNFVTQREDMVGIDGSIITNPKVWKASGHVDCFSDIIVECVKCRNKLRGDHLIEDMLKISADGLSREDIDKEIRENCIRCPKCGSELGAASDFNLMFRTNVGPVISENSIAYLRPETAQSIFVNFKLVAETARKKLPFGIGQIGKAFRNEISPRDFLFRAREFEQMEIEFFVHPDKLNDCPGFDAVEDMELNVLTAKDQEDKSEHSKMRISEMYDKKIATRWHLYWLGKFMQWFIDLGIDPRNLRLREHTHDELAHYAGACFDIEYRFPFGWKEIHGNADRKQYDLTQHANVSGKDMSLFDEDTKSKIVPYVASEPSQGVDRAFLTILFDAYHDDKERGNIVLRLDRKLAPIKAAVFPLLNKEPIEQRAKQIYADLAKVFNTTYDRSGSVGRRYARQDEIGTPICITIDFQTLEDGTVTLRDRDTTEQIRVHSSELKAKVFAFLQGEELYSLGAKI